MAKNTKKGLSAVELTVLGASLAGIAAGAYFFLGQKGQKHQKQVKAWAIKMKGDVVEKLETARDISEPIYHEIIDSIAKEYVTRKKASEIEVKALAQDLKKHWKTISSEARATKRNLVKDSKRIITKAKKSK